MKQICLLLVLLLSLTVIAEEELYYRVKIDLNGVSAEELARTGVACDHGHREEAAFTGDFSSWELRQLDQAGISYEILIADMAGYYERRLKKGANQQRALLYPPACDEGSYTTPANFHTGSMGGYLTYAEMLTELDEMAALYPNLISARASIDPSVTTHDGNELYWLRISDEPNVDSADPEILYTALHHAREPESLMQLIFYMWYLLENYASDAEVQRLVDNTELYFIPCVNPDGYQYNELTNPNGGGMWRKNRRANADGSFGVDLNRNYGYQWGVDNSGSSGNPSSAVYRGPSAFSEEETQLVRDFVLQHDFKVALNYHTYGDYVFMPWGYQDAPTADHDQYRTMGKVMTHHNCYNYGTFSETGSYGTNGDADDWMYGEQSTKGAIISCTPEVGGNSDGFWPAQSRIIPLAQAAVWQNLSSAFIAGKAAELHETSSPEITSLNASFDFDLQRIGLTDVAAYRVSVQPVSANISSVAADATFNNMAALQVVQGSIAYTIDAGAEPGEEVIFDVVIDNGQYSITERVSKRFQPELLFFDDFLTMDNWNTNAWFTYSPDFISPPYCITDSPGGNYTNNFDYYLETANILDFSDASGGAVSFWAKWDIENCYDQLTVYASEDGSNWNALCGRYTDPGTQYQDYAPVYDDDQTDWVREVIDLSDYAGTSFYLKFELSSDGSVNGDGFYLDDVSVHKYSEPLLLELRAQLEGPYIGANEMHTDAADLGLIPMSQPFNTAPWNYGGTESFASLPTDAVDWVLLELRDADNSQIVVDQKAVMLLKDGTVQGTDGNSSIRFESLTNNNYFVALRHKSHIDVITDAARDLSANSLVDFSSSSAAMSTGCKTMPDGQLAMAAGDFNADGLSTFADFNQYILDSSAIHQYTVLDTNLDGVVTVLDFNAYKQNYDWIGAAAIRY